MATKKNLGKTPALRTKKATAVKASATKKPVSRTKTISQEDIEKKAHEIYLERIAKGEDGHHEDDWHKALEILSKKK